MLGPYPDDANNPGLAEMRVTADTLEKLLGHLSIKTGNVDLLTWQIIKTRYQHSGLAAPALKNIEQQKRIIYAARQHQHIGLWEFHIGLIYLHWGEPLKALPYFSTAQRYWTLVNQTAAACLASFSQGCMQHFASRYEAGMVNYLRTQHQIIRLKRPLHRHVNREFISELDTTVNQAITKLRDSYSQMNYTGPGNIEEVFTPAVQPSQHNLATDQAGLADGPIPGHLIVDDQLVWYRIHRTYSDGFLPEVEPDDWVLVKNSPENEQIMTDDLVVVDDQTLKSSIRLTNAKTSNPKSNPRITLGRMIKTPIAFTRDPSGHIQFTKVQISEKHNAPVDFEKIVGVVLGFWSSNVR